MVKVIKTTLKLADMKLSHKMKATLLDALRTDRTYSGGEPFPQYYVSATLATVNALSGRHLVTQLANSAFMLNSTGVAVAKLLQTT